MNQINVERRGFPKSLLDGLYPLPRPYLNESQWERHHHIDLIDMTLDELYAEQRRLRYRLDYEVKSDAWLLARRDAIVTHIGDRRSKSRRAGRTDKASGATRSGRDNAGAAHEPPAQQIPAFTPMRGSR